MSLPSEVEEREPAAAEATARKIAEVLRDRRTLKAATSVIYPTVMALAVGITGTIVDLGLTAAIGRPWKIEAYTPAMTALYILLVLVFPILYFVLGGRYGLARAAFVLYESCRPLIADLVIEQIREAKRKKREAAAEPEKKERDVAGVIQGAPRALKWILRVIVRVIGTGDRLTEAVEKMDELQEPQKEVVSAIIDDIIFARVVEPARNAIVFTAVANAIALAGLWFV